MASWKKYGGLDQYDKSNHIATNSIVANYFTIKKQYVGDFDVCGNIFVNKQLIIDGSASVNGLLNANNANINGNLEVFNINCTNDSVLNNLILNNDLNINNNFLRGDINGIGINNRNPKASLDISGNNNTSIHVYNNKLVNRSVLSHNINHNGVALWSDSSNAYIDFFVETDISINNISFDGRIQFDHNGNLLIDANKYVNILPQLVISDLSADIVFNNSMVTIHGDNCSNIFNYDSYKNKSTFIQNAITAVTKDNSSVMFMNIMKPDKKGFSVAGGVCPYDTNRILGTIGFNDMSTNAYIANQTIVSGNSAVKYKSTVGINTYKPYVDNYVLDVNGPLHIRNGENNIVVKSTEVINVMKFGGTNKSFGLAICGLDGSRVPIFYSNDSGKRWEYKNLNDSDTLASSGIDSALVNLSTVYVYNANYAFTLGGNFNGFYTYNGGLNWQYITFNIPYAPKSMYICNNGNNSIRFFITAFTVGSVYDSLFFYDSAINIDSSGGYFNGADYNLLNLSDPIILNNTNNTSVIDGYGNYIYIAGNKGIFKYDINDPSNYTSHTVVDSLGNLLQFNSISVLDDYYVVAVGKRVISYSIDGGTNWVDLLDDFVYFHPQFYNFTSVNIFDSNNAIAVSDDGKIAFTNDGVQWNDAPDLTIFNLSGSEKMLDGFLNNVSIVDKNAFVLVNTNENNIDCISNIVYNYFPDLFNHENNNVLDVSGNMNLYGNISITPDNTSFIKIESNASTCNFLTGVKDMYVGKSDSTAVFYGNLSVKGLLDAPTIKFASTEVSFLIVNPVANQDVVSSYNIQYALDIKGSDPESGALGGSVRVGDKLHVYGNVGLFGNTKSLTVEGSSTLNSITSTSIFSNALSVLGLSQFNGNVIITNPSQPMDMNALNGALFVNGNAKVNSNLYVMSNMMVLGNYNNFYSLDIKTGNVNLAGALQIISNNLFLNSDASFNKNIYVNRDAIFNGNLLINNNYINKLIVNSDASFNGNIFFGSSKITNNGTLIMNSDASLNNKLSVNGDTNCKNIFVYGDASFNGNIFFGKSIINKNGNVILNNNIIFNAGITMDASSSVIVDADVSFNGNINIGNYGTKFTNDGALVLHKDINFNNISLNINDSNFLITDGNLYLSSVDNTTSTFYIGANSYFSGTVTSTYAIVTLSDYRVKKNILPLCDTSFSLDCLNPVFYYNTLSNKNDIGFIAHEVQEQFPFLVNGEKDGEDYQSVNYNGLIGMLVHEIKTLKERVHALEKMI
jgi:cytoskeletal protein CcmA (bactofilin family)